jgi:hypothetical protein
MPGGRGARLLAVAWALGGCVPTGAETSDSAATGDLPDGPPPIVETPTIDGPCLGPARDGSRLAVTTTDFATGALTIVDVDGVSAQTDVALGSTDAKPYAWGGYLYVLHRYQLDALDVLDPADWSLRSQQAIEVDGAATTNPHAIAFSDDGLAYIPLFASPQVRVYDLSDPTQPVADGAIDLSAVADADGSPEASQAIVCGDALLVSLERLDRDNGFVPRGAREEVAVIDRASGRLYDLDAAAEGIQGIALQGTWARQWRVDPGDPSGRSLLILSEGIERLDLTTLTSTWVVSAEVLAGLGIASYLQPQAFALTPEGDALYLASYTEDFAEVVVYRVLLDASGAAQGAPEPVLSGLQSSEQTLEIAGGTLWIGDRSPGGSGIRAYALNDAADDPLVPLIDEPLSTGLPPYSMTLLP